MALPRRRSPDAGVTELTVDYHCLGLDPGSPAFIDEVFRLRHRGVLGIR